MNGWVALLSAAVAVAVLVVVGTFAAFLATGRITLFPESSQSVAPEPEDTGVVDTSYSVLILNGTPDEGLEARMRDSIINAGWSGSDVFAGTSGNTDFELTTIYYVSDADEAAARGLASVIGGADLVQDDYYADPDDPDDRPLTIVIGLDRSTVQPEGEDPVEG